MNVPLDEKGLLPCPFCGGEPSVSTYETESLWSHDQVTYTKVECPECDIAFNSEPGYEVEAPEAWNRRAYLAAPPSPSMEMDVVGFAHPTSDWCHRLYSEIDMHCPKDGPRPVALVTLDQAQSALAARDAQVLRLTEENEALRKERDEALALVNYAEDVGTILVARIKALEEALRPFARHIDEMKFDLDNKGNELPDEQAVGWVYVTNGDFRRARTALKENAL
jgi:Lar family restriction alleviation protein